MKSVAFSILNVLLLSTFICPVRSLGNPENVTDTLKILVPHLSNSFDSPFVIKDTMHTRILNKRIQQIKSMVRELNSTSTPPSSVLGYRGLGLQSTNFEQLAIFRAFKGYMSVLPISYSSTLYTLKDINSDTEHLIARIGLLENLSTMSSGREITLQSLIPQELQEIQTRYGVITLEILSDTFNIDFSLLENRLTFIPRNDTLPKFSDIQITRAHEMSSSKYAFRLSSPEGIAKVDSFNNDFGVNVVSIDSMLIKSIPQLNALSAQMTTIKFENVAIFSPDVHKYSFVIKTADLGVVYLLPISFYIGAIDRISFLWVYSSDSVFDIKALKEFEDQSSSTRQVKHVTFQKHQPTNNMTNLLGKVISNSTSRSLAVKPGVYLKTDNYTARPLLLVK